MKHKYIVWPANVDRSIYGGHVIEADDIEIDSSGCLLFYDIQNKKHIFKVAYAPGTWEKVELTETETK